MTQSKREPFAKAVALRYSDSGGQTYGVEVLGFKLAGNFNETGAMLRAMGINARVDEEMRKAVEEFRERVKWYLRTTPLEHPGRADLTMDQAIKIVENIPTGPERGRE